jgi:hypothetical protein
MMMNSQFQSVIRTCGPSNCEMKNSNNMIIISFVLEVNFGHRIMCLGKINILFSNQEKQLDLMVRSQQATYSQRVYHTALAESQDPTWSHL